MRVIAVYTPQLAMDARFSSLCLRLLVAATSFSFLALQLSAQNGFISLDCGGLDTAPYNDSNGIEWVSDNNWIASGSSASIRGAGQTGLSKPLTTVRYFPGSLNKYCYELKPVTIGKWYLVRATCLYGNYDSGNKNTISFDLLLDADLWDEAAVSNSSSQYIWEVYITAKGTSINVCLARIGPDNPFISTLELRPLENSMGFTTYVPKGNYALYNLLRFNYGTNSSAPVRYPLDTFDRVWDADIDYQLHSLPMSTQPVISNVYDLPPSNVMMTAIGAPGGTPLSVSYSGLSGPSSYFIALYFAEINASADAKGKRVFDIKFNDYTVYGPLDIYKDVGLYETDEIIDKYVIQGNFNITLDPDAGSVLGPLLCALEVFRISDKPLLESTYGTDVQALDEVKAGLNLSHWTGDPCLPSEYKYDWLDCSLASPPRIVAIHLSGRSLVGTLSPSINSLSELTQISLDNNQLTGPIPDLFSLTKLQKLDLQDNNFSGQIPTSLATLPSLSELLLQNNNLSGAIPQGLLQKSSGFIFDHYGNQYLCNNTDSLCSNKSTMENTQKNQATQKNQSTQKNQTTYVLIIVMLSIIVTIVSLGSIGGIYYRRKRREKYGPQRITSNQTSHIQLENDQTNQRDVDMLDIPNHVYHFTYDEVKVATKNFSEKIGEGGFGKVFHGVLENGNQVAVKILSQDSSQGSREFLNEVSILSRVHHRNLVSLVGFCNDPAYILIYEFMSEGSLGEQLHGPQASSKISSWKMRLRIALDAAQGLAYLHMGSSPSIIHRDVKSTNILLNDKLEAKVADFGLSKVKHHDDATHISTIVVGTRGYLDPEYYSTLKLTYKSDVYSFGVVLLEIICGRAPQKISLALTELNIVEWVRSCISRGEIQEFIDPVLGSDYKIESMWSVAETAIKSLNNVGEKRPTMTEVVADLQEALKVETEDFSRVMDQSRRWEFQESQAMWEIGVR